MNSITVEKNFGEKYSITVESESILECLEKISVFSEVNKCTCCGSQDIYLSFRKVTPKQGANAGKQFTYYDFACRACGAKANIGMYNGGGVFLKQFEKYEKQAEPTPSPSMQPSTQQLGQFGPATPPRF